MRDAICQSRRPAHPHGNAQVTSVLGSLRRATKERHRALEALDTLSMPLRLDRYLQALRGFEMLLSRWEPRVLLALPERLHVWLASRSRYALARSDLEHLDCSPATDVDLLELCSAHVRRIDLASVAAAFGSLYVLEGSCLGGQVIAQAAHEAVDIGARGATYFTGSGSATASHWREFLALLDAEIANDAASHAAASNAAQQTFDALIGIFTALRNAPAAR